MIPAMTDTAKPNMLIELLITLIIPSIILMKLSGTEQLGVVNALLLALAFPLFWGARSLAREHKVNLFAALGLVSILLTGGIGLLQLDTQWLAIKEAAVPGLIGLVVIVSAYTSKPLVRVLLFSPALMNVERIQQNLSQRGTSDAFEAPEDCHLDVGRIVLFFFRHELLSGHLDCRQPGRHPRLQRGTRPDDPAELPFHRATLDANHGGGALLPSTYDQGTCRTEAERRDQTLTPGKTAGPCITERSKNMNNKSERDVEKTYPLPDFIAKLRRLADALEQGERFEIQIAGERISVPVRAIYNIEHEREGDTEEIEFQIKWSNTP